MHPPFGFALFYLRSIASRDVKTKDIYLGALPWVVMQLILVAIVIFWPQSVTYWLNKGPNVDLNSIKIEVPGFGGNQLSLPPAGGNGSASPQIPGLTLPPLNGLPGQPPATPSPPPADLSQPPTVK
jgi:hypothetical protein